MTYAQATMHGLPADDLIDGGMFRGLLVAAATRAAVKLAAERDEQNAEMLSGMITSKIVDAWNRGQRK